MNVALFFSTVRMRTLSITLLASIFLFLTKFSLAEELVKYSLSEEETRKIKSQLHPSPQGFSWHIYENVGLLKPIGWHERSVSITALENVPSSYIYATSPEAEKMKRSIIHKFILINNKVNSVHVFTFERPEESWESNWTKYGKSIIKNIAILPNMPVE